MFQLDSARTGQRFEKWGRSLKRRRHPLPARKHNVRSTRTAQEDIKSITKPRNPPPKKHEANRAGHSVATLECVCNQCMQVRRDNDREFIFQIIDRSIRERVRRPPSQVVHTWSNPLPLQGEQSLQGLSLGLLPRHFCQIFCCLRRNLQEEQAVCNAPSQGLIPVAQSQFLSGMSTFHCKKSFSTHCQTNHTSAVHHTNLQMTYS